ncbi:hypothetical protein [Mycolicibacterium sp. CBMA 234]|nr:hypothetical protein [Mycolicibacterium sp. CBMA 234]
MTGKPSFVALRSVTPIRDKPRNGPVTVYDFDNVTGSHHIETMARQ